MSPKMCNSLLGVALAVSVGICGLQYQHEQCAQRKLNASQTNLAKVKKEVKQQKNEPETIKKEIPSEITTLRKCASQVAQAQTYMMHHPTETKQTSAQYAKWQKILEKYVASDGWHENSQPWFIAETVPDISYDVQSVSGTGDYQCAFILSDPKTHDLWSIVTCNYSKTGHTFYNCTQLTTEAGANALAQGSGDIVQK